MFGQIMVHSSLITRYVYHCVAILFSLKFIGLRGEVTDDGVADERALGEYGAHIRRGGVYWASDGAEGPQADNVRLRAGREVISHQSVLREDEFGPVERACIQATYPSGKRRAADKHTEEARRKDCR